MGLEFLQRVRKTSIVAGLVLFTIIATYFGFPAGAAFAVGCAWSLVNLYFIGLFVDALLARESKLRLVWLALVKVPVLYAVGFLILRSGYFPIEMLLGGFMWPLVVITLKAVGRMILRMDEARHAGGVTVELPRAHRDADNHR